MAERIRIQTGAKKYEIENENGTVIGSFEINPTDVNIAKRYDKVQKFFDEYDFTKLENAAEDDVTPVVEFSDAVTEQLNYLLGYNVSESLFSFVSPLAVVEGDKLFLNYVLEMLKNIISEATKEQAAEREAKIAAATEGY